MSDAPGRFRGTDVKATGAHQKADTKNKRDFPLPDSLVYQVSSEISKPLRDVPGDSADPGGTSTSSQKEPQSEFQCTLDPHDASTLCQKEVATLIYMDVGRWSGSAPTAEDTQSNWGRRRDFGIVYGRLAVLCTYTKDPLPDGTDGLVPKAVAASVKSSPEFEKIRPLLKVLSSNPKLGRVQVTKAVLGRKLKNEIPKKDRIYVFLGDLHAPVMTDPMLTYSTPAEVKSLTDTGVSIPSVGSGYDYATLKPGGPLPKPRNPHSWRGRYDPGALARTVLPGVARGIGETSKAVVKADRLTLSAGAAAAAATAPVTAPAVIAVEGATSAVLLEIAIQTSLSEWPDPDGGEAVSVRDWFDRYHGTKDKKGADIFEKAGDDLLLWLQLLKNYQKGKEGRDLPVRLMQLGDLFDFWIGLKRPFSFFRGAKRFPKISKAREFLRYWLGQSLQNPPIKYLWTFDKHSPVVARPDLKTVFLYGNHDTYMGSLLPEGERLRGRFDDDPGLVAQHGHQEDAFNKESNATAGYLLTQAAFADDYVRGIEDPVSSLGPTLFGGSWTRLALADMAIRTCIFDKVKLGKKPAMTFVMGHTHEPVLQVIHVVSDPEDKEKARSVATAWDAQEPPAPTVSPVPPQSAGQSRDTCTSTAPGSSTPPAKLEGPQSSSATNASTSTSTLTAPQDPPPPASSPPAKKPPATPPGWKQSTAVSPEGSPSASPATPPSTSNSTATAASVATSAPPATPPVTSTSAPGDQSKNKDTSTKTR